MREWGADDAMPNVLRRRQLVGSSRLLPVRARPRELEA